MDSFVNSDQPSILSVLGPMGVGKSYLVKYITKNLAMSGKIASVIVFSPTSNFSGVSSYNFIPDEYVFPQYDQSILEKYLELHKGTKQRGLIIFDDCYNALANDTFFLQFITNHRHFGGGMYIIFTSQYGKNRSSFNPVIRDLTSLFCVFKCENLESIKTLHAEHGAHKTKQEFTELMLSIQKYEFLAIDKRTDDITKKYIKMKCPAKISDFKLKY